LTVASAAIDSRKSHGRSRIGNGSQLLPSVDGRSVWARIMRDTLDAVVAHCGGEGYTSELKRMQARRIAALEAELIHIEDRIARAHAAGEEPAIADLDLYGRLANGQRRHCEALGWDRTARNITPNLSDYLKATEAPQRAEANGHTAHPKPSDGKPQTLEPDERGGTDG